MSKPLALIIEDSETLATIFAYALEEVDYVTEVIYSGLKAQERLKAVVPNLIILDLHLPGVSGDSLLAQVRADERLAATRVIVATADPYMGDKLRESADMVLLKPVSVNQLKELSRRFRVSQPEISNPETPSGS